MTLINPHHSEVRVSVELETPDMTLNLGPQHPVSYTHLRAHET